MIQLLSNRYSLILACLLLTACSGTKHLPEGERLYVGAKIKLETTGKMDRKSKRVVEKAAEKVLRPAPNKTFLGMRPKLWRYMAAGDNPKGRFKKWLKKTGEAPVFISSVKPTATSGMIEATLFNIGIFNNDARFEIVEKKHTAKVIYTCRIHEPFTFNELLYSITDGPLSEIIQADKKNSIIKSGEDYSLDKLKKERERIDLMLKNKGYFYFNADYLIFKADTSRENMTITLKLALKESIPENALTSYRIRNVIIDQDYSLTKNRVVMENDTFGVGNTVFCGNALEQKINPGVILRSVYLKKEEVYTRNNHNITLNRLMSMGNFKFVRVIFTDADSLKPGYLDVTILMTPMAKRTFRAEIDLVTKSNNYTGPRMNFSFLNRNAFNGAELLNVSMAGTYEGQLSGSNKGLFSYSLSPQVELFFPRYILPFRVQTNSMFIPKTRFSLMYSFIKKVNYFDMRTLQFSYGFKWKEDIRKEHELNPINISYTSLGNKSPEFTELLASNPSLKKSYEEQFIAGGSYSYTYNEQVFPEKKEQWYLHVSTEFAGNLFTLTKSLAGEKPTAETPLRVIGSAYSQFARLSIDGRSYYNFKSKNKWAFRLLAGVAKPYGNSSILPYSRQFFSGGPNSIRAFHINSVGPGIAPQNMNNIGFLQMGGDVKLEANGEYRFGIYRFFKGALFADAGNIWLLKSNPANSASPFSFANFSNELAVGAGVGLRIDVSFFILRFDMAMPLRKPWLEDHHRWVLNEIDFGNPTWRSDNLILNVAIGYPF